MNILLIGSGGREHAIANALARSQRLRQLFVAPGNPGIARRGELVDLDVADHRSVTEFCRQNGVGLVVVGPEQPLIAGIADDLAAQDILVFGPTRAAARLEGSKGFTKDLCRAHHIPTADYGRFDNEAAALAFAREKGAPHRAPEGRPSRGTGCVVVKADGLAAGKGVVVAQDLDEAERAIRAMFAGSFGRSGSQVVIEEFLQGEEVSFFALCDGERALSFGTAQDHKRVGEGDTGPNTGGMGAYSPASALTPAMEALVLETIVEPTLRAMREMGAPYRGVLYAGLMLTAEGPKLIEYNARLGDPEAQVILPRLEDDLLELMLAAARGALPERAPRFGKRAALTVVLAAKNYPATPIVGTQIRELERAEAAENVIVTHAGTKLVEGKLLAAGGRVLNVTALADTVVEAQARAYAAVDLIDWPGGFCRRDIGWREVARERA